jgi:hypothetical protein
MEVQKFNHKPREVQMKIHNFTTVMALAALLICGSNDKVLSKEAQTSDNNNLKVSDYFQEFPWIGLISNEITYGPIEISDVLLNNQQKLLFVKPNEIIKGTLTYKIDASKLDSMHLYHLVVGITNVGAQDCITHTFGIWNSSGHSHFTLTAPSKPGVYQVRFSYFEGLSCQAARRAWNSKNGDPSSKATLAAIIVH